MRKKHSYVNFQELYAYHFNDFQEVKPKGKLTDEALLNLMNHAGNSKTLTDDQIDIIIDALRSHLYQ